MPPAEEDRATASTPPTQIACGAVPLDLAVLGRAGFATVVHRPVVGSTMDEARALARAPGTPLPAVVIADRQSAGRGRRGAGWWHADGSLAASLVLAGSPAAPPQALWSLACGVALAESIRFLESGVPAVVRWPNDVEVAGRKLAGIIVETASADRAVIGVGVNTTGSATEAPEPLRRRVATVPDLIGRPLDRSILLATLLPRLRELLGLLAADPTALARRYRLLCGLEGTVVTLYAGAARHTGLCRGIAASGGLVLDTPAGRMEFISGSLTDPADVWSGS